MVKRKRPHQGVYRNVWIKHCGPIPAGYHIHHIDGNPWNNDISNLMCVSPMEHYEIHKNRGDEKEANLLLAQIQGKKWDRKHIVTTLKRTVGPEVKVFYLDEVNIPEESYEMFNEPDYTYLYLAIKELKPREQQAIELRYLLDLPLSAVSEELGIYGPSASRLIHKALEKLRKKLKNTGLRL